MNISIGKTFLVCLKKQAKILNTVNGESKKKETKFRFSSCVNDQII